MLGVLPLPQEEVLVLDQLALRRVHGHEAVVGQNPCQLQLWKVRLDFFRFRLRLFFSDQLFAPFIGPYLYVLSLTRRVNCTTGTSEGAPPPSSPVTPQPRMAENGRMRRVSTVDTSTDQAGVRAIVEEQVCLSLSPFLTPQPSVGTTPTTYSCDTAETTPATGVSPCSRSSCA